MYLYMIGGIVSLTLADAVVFQESLEQAEGSEKEHIQERITQLTEELSLRNYQIGDLNQKILDSDQG